MTAGAGQPSRLNEGTSRGALAALLSAVGLAFVMYRPDRELPFHHLDFSEFLPILQSSASFWERTWKLLEFYGQFGRTNVLPYALLSAKWEWFEWWSPGWQFSRYVLMLGIMVLSYQLLRRLGASVAGATAGSSVFLIAPSATLGWVQLTMAEPLGTLLLLALCLAVLPARRLRADRWRWLVAGLLTAGILFTKEMLAPTLLLPLGLAMVTDEHGQLARPAFTRHARRFFVLLVVVGVLCLVPIVSVMLAVPSDGYYVRYGESFWPVRQIVSTWLGSFLPLDSAHGLPGRAMQIARPLMLLWLATGCWLFLRRDSERRNYIWLLVLAVLFPLVGALVYAPWPTYLQFYAIPYLIGAAIVVAFALTGFERALPRIVTAGAYAWWGALLLVGGINAHRFAAYTAASQIATHRLVTRVAGMTAIDSVLVATPHKAIRKWEGAASTLTRYASAVNADWPPAQDIACSEAVASPGSVVVYGEGLCSRSAGTESIVEHFTRLSLRRGRLVIDSVRIDVGHAASVQ